MRPVPLVPRFRDIAPSADLAIVDVWGVLHNGVRGTIAAGEALAAFRAAGGFVVLVSNAPRPAEAVAAMLDRFAIPRRAYDGIVTSGDVSRAILAADPGPPVFHLGPARDRPIFEGLPITEVAIEDAARVICTGLWDDEVETPEDYRPSLEAMQKRGQEMICSNPDIVVERGDKLIPCAGALGAIYEQLGGRIVWTGKPHARIYEAALDFAAAAMGRRVEPARRLAIGDALRTDVAGAIRAEARSLLIADGIHRLDLLRDGEAIDQQTLDRLALEAGVRPDMVAVALRW